MKVFIHHIYELKKGLRRLVLHTCPSSDLPVIERKLKSEGIPYLIDQVTNSKINVFFGDETCINVLKEFSTLALYQLSDQEDFILGTLLGYDLKIQCLRFLERVKADSNEGLQILMA